MFSALSLGDSSRRRVSERLTAEEEKAIARQIRRAEITAREAIKGIEDAEYILKRKPDRAERTRAGAVDRLESAVETVWKMSKEISGNQGDRSARQDGLGRGGESSLAFGDVRTADCAR